MQMPSNLIDAINQNKKYNGPSDRNGMRSFLRLSSVLSDSPCPDEEHQEFINSDTYFVWVAEYFTAE